MNRRSAAKWVRAICYSLAAVLLLLLAFNVYLNSVLDKRLRKQLENITDTEISFETAHANIFTLSLELNNVKTSYFRNNNREHLHSVNIEKVEFGGINPLKWINGNRLSMRSLTIKKGVIELDNYLFENKDSVSATMLSPFKEFSARNLHLVQTSFRRFTEKETDLQFSGDINLHNVRTGKDTNIFALEELNADAMDCIINDVHYSIPNSFQHLTISKVHVNSKEKTANLDAIIIRSPLSKEEYERRIGYQIDYVDVSAKGIAMTGFDALALLKGKFIVNKIEIDNPKLYAWRDRRLPRKEERKPLPDEMLADLETEVRIDTLKINDANIDYEEHAKDGPPRSGVISIAHVNAVTTHIYNKPRKDDPEFTTTNSTSSLAGRGTVETKFKFPMMKGKDYYVEGVIKNLDLTSLNQSCENLGLIHIESGQLNSLSFNFTFNKIKSEGKVVANYNNLRIDQLKITKDGRIEKDKLKTLVEKAIIIPLNKDKSMPVQQRTGKIEMQRDPTRFVWNYMLKSLLTGIRSSFNLGFLLPG
jgi:hypothetical protein